MSTPRASLPTLRAFMGSLALKRTTTKTNGLYKLQGMGQDPMTQSDTDVMDVVNAAIAVAPISVASFGALGDGSTDDTAAIRAALLALSTAGGGTLIVPATGSAHVVTDSLAVPSNCRITGGGTLRMSVRSKDLLTATSASNVTIDGVTLQGYSASTSPTTSTAESSSSAIHFVDCANVTVIGCTFTGFRYSPAFFEGCASVRYQRNTETDCALSVRFRGVQRGWILENHASQPALPASTFVTVIYLDSTDGHSYGVCTDIEIDKNHVADFVNSQAIEIHAGDRVHIGSGNVLSNVLIGVSVNPFNSADRCRDISIDAFSYVGTDTVGGSGGNYGLSIQGGAAGAIAGDPGYYVENVTINGPKIRNANSVLRASLSGAGAIFQHVKGLAINGIVCDGCYGSGVVISGDCLAVTGGGIVVKGTILANGRRAGVLFTGTGNTGRLVGVHVDDAVGAVQYDAVGDGLSIHDVAGTNIATALVVSNDKGVVNGSRYKTDAATTVDVTGASSVTMADTGACSVTNLTGGVEGQIVTLHFTNGNTTITRANAKLAGSVNFTGAANQSLTLKKVSTLWIEIGRYTTAVG